VLEFDRLLLKLTTVEGDGPIPVLLLPVMLVPSPELVIDGGPVPLPNGDKEDDPR
jgi:hypothetical protein